jgi:hypothetical protein
MTFFVFLGESSNSSRLRTLSRRVHATLGKKLVRCVSFPQLWRGFFVRGRVCRMDENPYKSPTTLPPVAKVNTRERLNVACGLCIVAGLLMAVIRSIWLADWVLCLSIALVIVGLWGGALIASRQNLTPGQ